MGKKYQGEEVIEFVTYVLSADIILDNDTTKLAILQDMVDAAKVSIANRHFNTIQKQYRKEGKRIANKTEVVKAIVKELDFSTDDLLGNIARSYGIKL